MASGLGTRFGGNKLMADFGGKPMIQWILDATTNLFKKRVVVTRNEGVRDLCASLNIDFVYHSLPHRSDTVRLGIEQMPEDIDGCMFCLADQPFLTYATISHLLKEASNEPDKIWRPSVKDTPGSPLWFPKSLFGELSNLPEGKGGNVVAKRHSNIIRTININNPVELQDIDTKEVYNELISLAPVYQTLSDFQISGKKHLLITGPRNIGKTTLINKLLPVISGDTIPTVTTWTDHISAVYFTDSLSGKERTIGVYDPALAGRENRMTPLMDELKACALEVLNQMLKTKSEFVAIDEIGFLECGCEEYSDSLLEIMAQKRLIAVVRRQNLPFLKRILEDSEAFVLNLV